MGRSNLIRHFSSRRSIAALGLTVMAAFSWAGWLRADDGPPWWDKQWTVRKKIVLDTTTAGAPLTEPVGAAPVLLRLHPGNFDFTLAREDAADLRFIAEDGKTVLPHHVERYDGLVSEAFVWVRLPEVKTGAQTTLWLYSGNPEPTRTGAAPQPKATYDDDTVLVYHFNEKGVPAVDSSGRNNVSQNAGLAVDGSMIGGGIRLDGRSGLLIAPTDSLTWGGGAGLTWSAWIKPVELGADAVLFSQRDGGNAFVIGLNAGVPYVEITTAAETQRSQGGTPLTTSVWRHLAVTATPAQTSLFLDGTSFSTLAVGLPALKGTPVLGVETTDPAAPPTGFIGEVDELNISRVPRTEGYLRFAALSQGADKSSKLLNVGADEHAGHGGTFAEISRHLSLFGEISKSLTFDGWVVIALCALLSVVGWMIAIAKYLYLNKIKTASATFLRTWEALGTDLTVLDHGDEDNIRSMGGQAPVPVQKVMRPSPLYHLYQIGSQEIHNRVMAAKQEFQGLSGRSITAIRATLDGGLTREVQKLNSQLVFLTIGIAGGPYLGLLGTVIGVMITFAVIAKTGDVEVNSIAPGIAGALLATVAGLAVAIPALFVYSYLSTRTVAAGRSPEAAAETLDDDAKRIEGLQLSLRTRAGVPAEALDGEALPGLVECRDDRWVLTRRGRLMANEVAVRLR